MLSHTQVESDQILASQGTSGSGKQASMRKHYPVEQLNMLGFVTVIPLAGRTIGIAVRIAVASLCCFAIFCCWRLARADYLFRKDTAESVRSAIGLVPDAWEYYLRLSQLDPADARKLLESAVRLDVYNAQVDIELGLRYEADGQYDDAEKLLLAAFDVDHTYLPRWSLANFYFRREDVPAFWTWARSAAQMPSEDIGPLFELCWRESPDPEHITQEILNDNPQVIRQYLSFLLRKQQLPAVASIAPRLIRFGAADTDGPFLFSTVNQLVAAGNGNSASALWRLMVDHHWVVADATIPNNGKFAREPLPVSFDWSLPSYAGLHSWPGPSGLETEFAGGEPENCVIAEQTLILMPGSYLLEYSFRTTDIPPNTGIHWQIAVGNSDNPLATSTDLSSETMMQGKLGFSVPPDLTQLRLRLIYQRALGTPRISGMLVIPSVEITALPPS